MQTHKRIDVLDGLRVIAILIVMIYHFYYRFNGEYYHQSFTVPKIFEYGYLGVPLFFVISGFVITLTLTKCTSFSQFIKRRFIRLIPGMLICSVITFLVFTVFDTSNLIPDSSSPANLLVSNTFISTDLFNLLLHSKLAYIDPVYWSLWVEVQFYILGGLIYFLSPNNFLRNFGIFTAFAVVVYVFKDKNEQLHTFLNIASLFQHSIWFLAGIVVNRMYFVKKDIKLLALLLFLFAIEIFHTKDIYVSAFGAVTAGIFLLFLYNQKYMQFLGSKFMSAVGVASYSLYLIHENIGVLIINRLSPAMGSLSWILPIVLMALFTAFCVISYKYLEVPIGNALKKVFFRTKKESGPAAIDAKVGTLP